MNIRIPFAAAISLFAAACTTASGPTYNLDVVHLGHDTGAYRVQCHGLLESSKTCMVIAKRVCADKDVNVIGSVDRNSTGNKPEGDPRELTFTCGVPPAQVSKPVEPPVVEAPAPTPVRKITLQGDTNFEVNSAVLSPGAQEQLERFVESNRHVDIHRLTIAGYTDSTGSDALNNRLSAARARAVQVWLASHGLRAQSYDVQGYGKASPVASNATVEGRAKNRRVEVQTDGS